jgi:hypothetical protein
MMMTGAKTQNNSHSKGQGYIANDINIDCIGPTHMMVGNQAEHFTMRHSSCDQVEIETSGTPHMTVSQLAEQVKTSYSYNNVKIECIQTRHMPVST